MINITDGIPTDSGHRFELLIDAADDIRLDAGGNDIVFKAAGTEISRFSNASSDLKISTSVTNKNIILSPNGTGQVNVEGDISASGDITGDTVTGNIVSAVGGFGNYRTISSNQTIPADFNAVLYVSNYNPTIKISSGVDYVISEGADVAITNMTSI